MPYGGVSCHFHMSYRRRLLKNLPQKAPVSWGRCALLLHGKGLCVTLFYSPLQNGRSAREHLLCASGRAGQKASWRSATPFAHPRCAVDGLLTACQRGGCGTQWCMAHGARPPLLDRRTPYTIAKEKSL